MEKILFIFYNVFFVPVLKAGVFIFQFFNKKLRDANKVRNNQWKFLEAEMAKVPQGKTRLLFHASSVGECEQALPIIEQMKRDKPDLFIAITFFSSSGFKFMKNNIAVDLKMYLPFDSYFAARKLFRIIKPSLWFISKFDIWPNHVWAAKSFNIPIIHTAATLSENSGRYKGLAGFFNKFVYRNIDLFFPISEADSERFQKLVPSPEKMIVAGDTRFDQVFNKSENIRTMPDVKIFKYPSKVTFVAGSIWQPDEKELMPALVKIIKKYTEVNFILVPHELHESHIQDIENVLKNAGLESERYTNFEKDGGTRKQIAILNTVGLLARVYKSTQLAYIGGSFSSGVHNVMEPAVFGQPVFFGPVYVNSFEAMELLKIGCAFTGKNSTDFEKIMDNLLQDENYRTETGKKARDLVCNNIGASQKIIKTLYKKYDFFS